VRSLGDEVGELKRLYVDPRARGSGAGMALMSAMEDAARRAGHRVARLDTDPSLEEAQELFERRGYRQIPPYNDNPNAGAWWEKDL
jgi:GNAT superfamily N-acetyltransferase